MADSRARDLKNTLRPQKDSSVSIADRFVWLVRAFCRPYVIGI